MRDQLDRDAVYSRIPLVLSGLELRQLVIVALRHARPNFAPVLNDDEKGIEKPRARGRDVDAARHRIKQQGANLVQDSLRFGESR